MHNQELTDQEQVRLDKLNLQRSKGYPYPNDARVSADSSEVKLKVEADTALEEANRPRYTLAGRLMSMRMMGKAAFCDLQDHAGRIQLYVKKDAVGEEAFEQFRTFDLGDIVEVSGYSFFTKTKEPSLHADSIRLLVKCLHPLPEKWHGLADKEIRYRQRYLDLIINPEVKQTFIQRSKIISGIRRFFDARGYIEVETPVMNSIASGAAARPFITHHNALDLELNLRIALELPLKRLIVGGIDRVYELGRVFRNEGISTEHNPEFTMLEFYQAYATYETMMDLTEELIVSLCDQVVGKRVLTFREREINLNPPWRRLTMIDAIYEIGGISKEFDLYNLAGAKAVANKLGLAEVAKSDDLGLVLYGIFDKYVEEKIIEPMFITRHPLSISPLARPSLDDPRFVDRFELIINGFEVANAFSELNDPQDQQKRFEEQLELLKQGEEEAMPMDEDFVRALEYGMPPTAGEGIGIDRLVMILTNSPSIRDVILFPQMRPHE